MKIDDEFLGKQLGYYEEHLIEHCGEIDGIRCLKPENVDEKTRDLLDRHEELRWVASKYQAHLQKVPRLVFVSTQFNKASKPENLVRNILNWTSYRWKRDQWGTLRFTFGFKAGAGKVRNLIAQSVSEGDISLVFCPCDPSHWIGWECGINFAYARPTFLAYFQSVGDRLDDQDIRKDFGVLARGGDAQDEVLEDPPLDDWLDFKTGKLNSNSGHALLRKMVVPLPPFYGSDREGWKVFEEKCSEVSHRLNEKEINWLEGCATKLVTHLKTISRDQERDIEGLKPTIRRVYSKL